MRGRGKPSLGKQRGARMKYLCLVYHDEESEVDHMSESEFAAVEQDVREYIGRLRDRGNHIVAAPLQAPAAGPQ